MGFKSVMIGIGMLLGWGHGIGMLLGWGHGTVIGATRVETIFHIPKTEIKEWEASIVMVIHV